VPLKPDAHCTARIGLGTVQFGLDYGISNPEGRTPPAEVERILSLARNRGITVLDTAPAYGESERVLGTFPLREQGFKVVTKTPIFGSGTGENLARCLYEGLEASLSKLGITRAYALLFHRAADLTGGHGSVLVEEARSCRDKGLVEKIGVSVYTADEIDAVMDRLEPDLVQLPLSVFDQRLLQSGHLDSLRSAGVEIHIRSVFLQGLLLMDPGRLPPGLAGARAALEAFHAYARGQSRTPLEAALGFALGLGETDTVICGVNSSGQLEEICSGASPLPWEDFHEFALADASILNPSQWSAGK